jgi:hypothetical protein
MGLACVFAASVARSATTLLSRRVSSSSTCTSTLQTGFTANEEVVTPSETSALPSCAGAHQVVAIDGPAPGMPGRVSEALSHLTECGRVGREDVAQWWDIARKRVLSHRGDPSGCEFER